MNARTARMHAWLCLAAAMGLATWAALTFLEFSTVNARESPDPWAIARQVERFAPLRSELPPNSIVEYYTDIPYSRDSGGVAAFFGACYALAPHLLVYQPKTIKPELVVGSFLKRPDLVQLEQEQGLVLVKNYGRGLMLFRRKGN